jgi:hypothetical protein
LAFISEFNVQLLYLPGLKNVVADFLSPPPLEHSPPDELLGNLLSAPLVWVRRGGVIPPLQPLYDGPYTILRRGPRSFTIRVGPGTKSSPSAASRLARPRTPRLAARVAAADRRVCTQAVLPQPSGSRFQTRCFLHLPLRRCQETVLEPFSYPSRRFLGHHMCHKRGTRPVNGHRHRGWTTDLFSSRPRPELGGSPVDTCVHPWRRSDQLGVLHQPCTAFVYKLLCNCQ